MADIDPLSLDFATRHPDSFARILGRGDAEESARILESLPAERKAAIVARLPSSRIQQLLDSDTDQPAEWLAAAPFDDAVTLLSRIPRERRLALVNSLTDRERRRQLLRHQQYPTHSVGTLVGDIRMRISSAASAADVQAELQEIDAEDPGPLVVVDADGCYLGVLDRWRLLIGDRPTGQVKDYLIEVRPVHPETPIATAAMIEDWHTRNWLPVIDHRRRVLGGVSRARVFRAASEHSIGTRRASDLTFDLLTDLVYVLGSVLERALSPKKSP